MYAVIILSASANFQKATNSVVMFVCQSVRMKQYCSQWT